MSAPDFIVFDLEATGLDAHQHEIIEIGALRVSADLQNVLGEFSRKVMPLHPETADPEANAVTHYRAEAWVDARPLADALREFSDFGKEGILAGYNITFDWLFLNEAFRGTGIKDPFEYHRFDIFSLAYDVALRASPNLARRDLNAMIEFFHLPSRVDAHDALGDAKTALALWCAVRQYKN